jgi:hypothetical protein
MAVELKMRIESNLGVDVPIAVFVDGQTTRQAAARLVEALRQSEETPLPGGDDDIADLLASVEDLSEEDAQLLLRRSASGGGGLG